MLLDASKFDHLGDGTRESLLSAVDRHSLLRAAFTPAGTLTYGPDLLSFTFRYEVSTSGDHGEQAASEMAALRATATLEALGCGHRGLPPRR